mmetsp:Transcript_9550/g.17221  ORF Transcript_9550/g.17221 Transcript_9550/m.17221 type:complete len:257 (+) Transcript_9550:1074-1844(+)
MEQPPSMKQNVASPKVENLLRPIYRLCQVRIRLLHAASVPEPHPRRKPLFGIKLCRADRLVRTLPPRSIVRPRAHGETAAEFGRNIVDGNPSVDSRPRSRVGRPKARVVNVPAAAFFFASLDEERVLKQMQRRGRIPAFVVAILSSCHFEEDHCDEARDYRRERRFPEGGIRKYRSETHTYKLPGDGGSRVVNNGLRIFLQSVEEVVFEEASYHYDALGVKCLPHMTNKVLELQCKFFWVGGGEEHLPLLGSNTEY